MLISNPLNKLQKKFPQKSERKMEYLTFITGCKSCRHFLLTLKPNVDETAKKKKYTFYNCVLESWYTHLFSVWDTQFGKKKVKMCTPIFFAAVKIHIFLQ